MRRLTVGRVVLLLPLTAIIIAARLPIRDNSFLWHIRAGILQLEQGSVLTRDPFSFTLFGEPWRTQSWMAELLYGYFEQVAPLAIGPWITFLSGALIVYLVALRAYRRAPTNLVAGIVGLAVMWISLGWFSPRPVVISLALLALLVLTADDRRLAWAIPLVLWVWASVHGGFIVGLAYLVLDGLRRKDRRRVRETLAATIAVSLTAHGWGVWQVLYRFVTSSENLDLIVEWDQPDFFGLALVPFLGFIVAFILGGIRGDMDKSDLWVVVPFLMFALTASRAVPMASIVLVPWLAAPLRGVDGLRRNQEGTSPILVGVAAMTIVVPLVIPIRSGLDRDTFPVTAAAELWADRVFHDDGAGGYLIYEQHDERLVFVDDRAELYGPHYKEFVDARAGRPVWQDVFEDWTIEQVLLRNGEPLVQVLRADGWQERFVDEEFTVLDAPGGGDRSRSKG